MNEEILSGIVILVSLGAGAQWLAWRLHVPSILVLLITGFVAGPVTGILDPDKLLGHVMFPFVSLGAALVLFEGGLTTSWQEIRSVATPVRRLVTFGMLITWLLTTVAAYGLFGLRFDLAALLGAILVVTGPTVVGPLVRHCRPRGQVGSILEFEGIINDPIGAVLAVLVFQIVEVERFEAALSLIAIGVLKAFVFASAIGFAASWLYTFLRSRNWLPERLESAALVPLALGVFASANHVQHESGLLAVTVMGIALASQRKVNIEPSVEFTEQARDLLIPILFVLLTARMEITDLTELPVETLWFVAALIFLVRPVAVFVSTMRSGLSFREQLFVGAVAPRGIVAAAVASVFSLRLVEAGFEDAGVLMPITFVVIGACVVVYGLGANPLVKALKLQQLTRSGVLVMGANELAREIARALNEHDIKVILVDSHRVKVAEARTQGLQSVYGRVLSAHVLDRLDFDEMGHFLALTPNDDANALAVIHFQEVFGEADSHQVGAGRTDGPGANPSRFPGRPFAGGRTYEELSALIHRGATCKVTKLTEKFGFDDYVQEHHEDSVVLFAISTDHELRVVDLDHDDPKPGESVISLVPSEL